MDGRTLRWDTAAADVPSSAVEISIVIPVFNEAPTIPVLCERLLPALDTLGRSCEVIFVDDGSQDRSAEIVRAFREADPRVRLLRLKANSGETAATDAGFKATRGRYVVGRPRVDRGTRTSRRQHRRCSGLPARRG